MTRLDLFVSVVMLFAFAVAQPLFDLLGRNAEFFLARNSPALDIVMLAVGLAVVASLLVGLVGVAASAVGVTAGRLLHGLVLGLFGTALAVLILKRTPADRLDGRMLLGVAGVLGVLVVWAFSRFEWLRTLLRYLWPVPLVFAGLFLFGSTVTQLLLQSSSLATPVAVAVGSPAPVVLVIFDEFPVASVIDGEGNLQVELYPNLARLADDGTWFRNSVTVQQQTEESLPAILTGVNPPLDKLPIAAHYPASLFTLLSDTYDLAVFESVTEMCPAYACANTRRVLLPVGQRWASLVEDLGLVAAHLYLPDDLAAGLAPVNQTWGDFGQGGSGGSFNVVARFNQQMGAGRREPIHRFLDEVGPPAGEPSLYFLHALLPHHPWQYLPSGQQYPQPNPLPGRTSTGWGRDQWLVAQGYQGHLLQVQYVDTIVGHVIDRLEAQGLYEEALVIVLADHGVAVRPGVEHHRVITPESIGEVAAIPLFIKRPHDPGGVVDDYRALTIDVLPTIADVLDIDLPWEPEGASLFAVDRPVRTETTTIGARGPVTYGVDGREKLEVAARKVEWFGGNTILGLAPPGTADLLGVARAGLAVRPAAGVTVAVDDRAWFDDVDPTADLIPARLSGRLIGLSGGDAVLAICLNGEVAAVTRTYTTEGGVTRFSAILPPDRLQAGPNQLQFLLVEGEGEGRRLWQVELG